MNKHLQVVTRIIITGILVMITSSLLASPAGASARSDQEAQAQSAASVAAATLRVGDWCGPGSNNWRSWFIPDHFYQADWSEICKRHDRCYSSNSLQDRSYCDSAMNKAMVRECSGAIANPDNRVRCINRARTYYNKVRSYARPFYHGHGSRA